MQKFNRLLEPLGKLLWALFVGFVFIWVVFIGFVFIGFVFIGFAFIMGLVCVYYEVGEGAMNVHKCCLRGRRIWVEVLTGE
jgi:hypothetical protein